MASSEDLRAMEARLARGKAIEGVIKTLDRWTHCCDLTLQQDQNQEKKSAVRMDVGFASHGGPKDAGLNLGKREVEQLQTMLFEWRARYVDELEIL